MGWCSETIRVCLIGGIYYAMKMMEGTYARAIETVVKQIYSQITV
jgi:hypothetical protein